MVRVGGVYSLLGVFTCDVPLRGRPHINKGQDATCLI